MFGFKAIHQHSPIVKPYRACRRHGFFGKDFCKPEGAQILFKQFFGGRRKFRDELTEGENVYEQLLQ